jgi:hypothetical protein
MMARILGANRSGFAMLGLRPADIGKRRLEELFNMTMPELMDLGRHAQGRPVAIHIRARARRLRHDGAVPPPSASASIARRPPPERRRWMRAGYRR